ncbi:SMI1/KNR4 family protein [Hymenobacter jejuensis]|uniref:SMI1/KNR4 family protein n=1 Tax=Hymenobacter jejuensis TaxID=2502781 RepID=A0A5B7ZV91_9BACT|nr:SMI1/KNR4 family protein [Hymenobacter jejuensis]QDA58709.1 SMI1/KNR4 family protein [Hymenobacter jejuensis]
MKGVLYTGESITDPVTFTLLPSFLQQFLLEQNGVVAYFGGLHIRGCCQKPAWHSLAAVWKGERALHKVYAAVKPTDVPFAQDCVGNQFLLRNDAVLFLDTETGEIADLNVDFKHFLFGIEKFPVDALGLEPLQKFQQQGGYLQPGHLLSVYPPVCIKSKEERKLKPVPAAERLASLADFYRQIKDLPDGQFLRLKPSQD